MKTLRESKAANTTDTLKKAAEIVCSKEAYDATGEEIPSYQQPSLNDKSFGKKRSFLETIHNCLLRAFVWIASVASAVTKAESDSLISIRVIVPYILAREVVAACEKVAHYRLETTRLLYADTAHAPSPQTLHVFLAILSLVSEMTYISYLVRT